MKLVRKKLTELKPADYNPRRISSKALKGLCKSIEKFGYIEPIVWNKMTGNVIAGHQRLKVLEGNGNKTIMVVEVEKTLEEEKALNITLNNEHIRGEWDGPKKELLLGEIKVDLPEFDELRLPELSEIKIPETEIEVKEEKEENNGRGKGRLKQNFCPNCGFDLTW